MKRLHLICNAHIDPIWQWTWNEGIAAAVSTFKSAADLAEEYDYIFCHNEALLYEAVERYAPDLFARIKTLVKAGKWHIMGGWYLQPDCNMPCGESVVRQIKAGQAYFESRFGVTPHIAANFDSFGHSIGLVQILRKCGYTGYIVTRPNRTQFGHYPGKFFSWQAPNGSCITVLRAPNYGSSMGEAVQKITKEAEEAQDVDCVLWGVGNHGGGPSRKDLREIAELRLPETEILHSTPEKLFADDIKLSGIVTESLEPCMPGCYTSMMRIKQMHRQTENLYYETEKLIAAASFAGFVPDREALATAEKKLLLSEFHDILPGSCIEAGEKEGLALLSYAQTAINNQKTAAFLHLAMREKAAEEGEYPIFVYNPLPYSVTVPVEAEFTLANQNWSGAFVMAPTVWKGSEQIPCQQIKEGSTLNLDWRKRVVFSGTLAPLALTRFSVRTEKKEKAEQAKRALSLSDCLKKQNLLCAPVSLRLYEDSADPWAMGADELHTLGKNPVDFVPMTPEQIADFCAIAPIPFEHVTEDGCVFTSVEQLVHAGHTNAVLSYRFYADLPYVDIHVTLEFADKNKLVRLCIPVPQGETVGDGPYVVEKKMQGEVTFQKWLGVDTGSSVFAVINDGVYGGRVENGMMELTLVRGAGYCFHPICERTLYPQDRYLPRIDNGRYEYSFRIFRGSVGEVCTMAEAFAAPFTAVNVFPIGKGSALSSGIRTDVPVCMPVCRLCENGGILMRFFNPEQTEKHFTLFVAGQAHKMKIKPAEVVSVGYKDGAFTDFENEMPLE